MESRENTFFKDKYMMKVFESILTSPKSAQQISDECDIPKSTVYKKIKILEDQCIIQTKGVLQNGVKNRIFQKKNQN